MSDGFFHWYRATWGRDDADRFLRAAAAAGLRLANPETGRPAVLTNGPDSWGEQVFVKESELLDLVAEPPGGDITFQFWLNPETDVLSRVRMLDEGGVVQEFDLDGLSLVEREQALVALVRILETDIADCWGFVIDREGVSQDLDWDGLMAGAASTIVPRPDSFGIRREYVAQHPELAGAASVAQGELEVFTLPR
ncbi:MAG: hypothetical protein JO362_23305 [Streptomycetaceae bacterium]|nr:hypothetical protein [Streptomycetaceae bacterium]